MSSQLVGGLFELELRLFRAERLFNANEGFSKGGIFNVVFKGQIKGLSVNRFVSKGKRMWFLGEVLKCGMGE